ncbi:hypothetical protein CAEBREN_08044 [Caenorhabditis brenneri]|uniref:Uncharacterized protein n=1 Tax=Caenorhabditis brenneri TaxID=135651 RepID=G0NDA5_CAEBE|nr:hypothetical protein CAEBREN_08044 [Caenorhabditis brenneri]
MLGGKDELQFPLFSSISLFHLGSLKDGVLGKLSWKVYSSNGLNLNLAEGESQSFASSLLNSNHQWVIGSFK